MSNSQKHLPQQVAKISLSQAIQNPAVVAPNSKGLNPTFTAPNPDRISNAQLKLVYGNPTFVPFENK